MKNKSNQTPHKIFTQYKTHFDYAPKKKKQSHSQFQTHPFAKKKSTTIKQNPDEKIKVGLSNREREREREFCETERVERKRSLLGMTDLFDFKLVTSLKC